MWKKCEARGACRDGTDKKACSSHRRPQGHLSGYLKHSLRKSIFFIDPEFTDLKKVPIEIINQH